MKISELESLTDYERLSKLVEVANALSKSGELETTADLERIIAANDVVFAVWQDLTQPEGVSFTPIKGQALFHGIVDAGKLATVTWTAIPYREATEAAAMQEVLGD
jgi:hypothetical protein